MISIVCPAYNEAENLRELYRQVSAAMEGAGEQYELIIVENGSTDNSIEILKQLREKDDRVHYLSLSRNFGHQGANLAGLHHSRGDAVITMDADLQHPPALLPELIRKWKEGFDVVYTVKDLSRSDIPFLQHWFTRWFYILISYLSGLKMDYGQSDFRLLDRKVVNVIDNIPAKDWFLRGIVSWVGFAQTGITYEVHERFAGSSKFSFGNYLSFALKGIFSFSIIPLRIMTFLGLGIAALSFAYGFWISMHYLLGVLGIIAMDLPRGWSTVIVAIMFIGGIQLIGLGLLGEYVGRSFHHTLGRPAFIVKDTSLERED